MRTVFSYGLFKVETEESSWRLSSQQWPGFKIGSLTCYVCLSGQKHYPEELEVERLEYEEGLRMTWMFKTAGAKIIQKITNHPNHLEISNFFQNLSTKAACLTELALLDSAEPGETSFGTRQEESRVYEDGGYWGHVRKLSRNPKSSSEAAEQAPSSEAHGFSQLCWEVYNPFDKMAFLAGFLTFERWLGMVEARFNTSLGVAGWKMYFDAGDLIVYPGEVVELEDIVLMLGQDPWLLLEWFGDLVREKHCIRSLGSPPVSWCSWYPFRLGVSEERVLENARIGFERLKSLGLRNIQVDLGWEKDYLPSSYDENEQFPHGLKWLSEQLGKMGLNLGVWKAPFTISEFDPVAVKHPEWLLGDEKEKPAPYWTWFWKPYGKVYALDLTHPGAQSYLREKIASLAKRGVKYFKLDFMGGPCNQRLRNRYNRKIVAGGGVEAVRLGCRIIAETLKEADPECLVLNCNPYEPCGLGYFQLLYTCNDTGNTGYVTWQFMKENYRSVASHLWKNHRLGIIQPSCLCVGPPGTLEEARIRATVAYLSGGEISIGDDLTTLPEDRWQVLLSVLPPAKSSAKPVDLFEPVAVEQLSYEDMSRSGSESTAGSIEEDGGSIWVQRVDTEWDSWIIAGLFAWEPPKTKEGKEHLITRFDIPWSLLGLDPERKYWVYEFWSGQFLGEAPSPRRQDGYTHPGDAGKLLWSTTEETLQVTFFGPAARVLAIRDRRQHPWIVGTSFHLTSGGELRNVAWDEAKKVLKGELHRTAGQLGFIVAAGIPMRQARATVDNHPATVQPGANGSLIISMISSENPLLWEICFEEK
ncbi:MAG: alpha-galactosidase [Crenarchaeota archaeon]|nr:alpha-galactosidase [Thermoproteota archaeon]